MTDNKVRCLTCSTEATWEEWTQVFVRGRRSGNMNCPVCHTPIDIKVAGKENWVCTNCGRWHNKTVSCEDFVRNEAQFVSPFSVRGGGNWTVMSGGVLA